MKNKNDNKGHCRLIVHPASMAIRLFVLTGLFFAAVALAAPTKTGNMNGKYIVATGADVNVPFNDDYASKGHEYFDVWAPEIATQHGEVFWTDQGDAPLPPAIVERFKGKVMAITGYEQDQVMVTPTGQPGVNPEQDVSVPINWAYNHHYLAWMTGAHSQMVEIDTSSAMYMDTAAHGAAKHRVAVDKKNPSMPRLFGDVAPTSQMFSEGNGGESRKSFHGYPNGFAQLIESPETWSITPMQIDTRNRECGTTPDAVHNCTIMTPGIEPRSARYGRDWQGLAKLALPSNYSGLVECPCNSRYGGDPVFYPNAGTKEVIHNYAAIPSGLCGPNEGIATAAECFSVAQSIGIHASSFKNQSVRDDSLPAGCSVTSNADGTATVNYNSAGKDQACQSSNMLSGQVSTAVKVTFGLELQSSGTTGNEMERDAKGTWCSENRVDVIASFRAKSDSQGDMLAALSQCEQACLKDPKCTVCSVDDLGAPPQLDVQFSALPTCGTVNKWGGAVTGDISTKVASSEGNATITLTGPADVWYGVGLNAQNMADSPYSLIVTPSNVSERKIGTCGSEAEHCAGDELASSITVVSNDVNDNVRTVVLSRPLKGLTPNHLTFHPESTRTINFISAVGSSQDFAYHKEHDASILTLTGEGSPTCLCDQGAQGQLCNTNNTNCGAFTKSCLTRAQGGDLDTQKNPTCNSLQYAGGLRCCSHKNILLDDDQIVPPQLLRYHMKFRFWFQEYVPANATVTPKGTTQNTTASHFDLPRIYFQTEADAGEYDIPPAFSTRENPIIPGYNSWPEAKLTPGTSCTGNCPDGTDCECVHTITYNHTVSNMRLIYAGGHCHAPSCIGIWLYRNDPGHDMELLCHQQPIYGQGNVKEDKYDEAGYLTLPPCLWGEDNGLNPSVLLPPNTQLVSIKKNVNTKMGHYGEMASWQMRGVGF